MANLINANSNQNYFQFRGSHYKYEKGVPLGLPTSTSIFKNFLQNLEGKFIKSNSKSKAIIHYPTGCPRRQWTHDLFISSYPHCMDPADPCGNLSWSSQSFTCHQILCDILHGIHDVQEMQVSVMINDDSTKSWCTDCYQMCSIWEYMATMAVAKGMLHNPNQYNELLMIHWGIHTK